jgi:16S rRNA (uracil1498-N3)-methyltransferase
VLRVEPGQLFELSDNRRPYLAEIVEAHGDRVRFRVIKPLNSPIPALRVTLCAALFKFDRFEWMVEKSTELGVERILPVEATRSEKGLFEASRKRAERWARIAREASQQSRRVTIPEILPAVRFPEALAIEADLNYFLDEAEAPALPNVMPERRECTDRAAVLLGPEGGWTEEERQAAIAARWQPISLGPTILRAETAAAAALATLGSMWLYQGPLGLRR